MSNDIFREYSAVFGEVAEEAFPNIPVSDKVKERLGRLLAELICCQRLEFAEVHSGVVIAGFGSSEYYPALLETTVAGVVSRRLLHAANDQHRVGEDAGAYVIPFAQKDMVHTFMEGIDPELQGFIQQSATEIVREVAVTVIKDVKETDPKCASGMEERVLPAIKQLAKQLIGRWREFREVRYAASVMEMVDSLPKDELGLMAESLVNLTKFKRKVTKAAETVGGPIDVAVITKGDGFVWLRRKHYFKPEENPRYFERLREEYGDETAKQEKEKNVSNCD